MPSWWVQGQVHILPSPPPNVSATRLKNEQEKRTKPTTTLMAATAAAEPPEMVTRTGHRLQVKAVGGKGVTAKLLALRVVVDALPLVEER